MGSVVRGDEAVADSVGKDDKVDIIPEIHGVFRGRYEMDTKGSESRFQVRNARLIVQGKVAPVIDYRFQADMCDKGTMMILDAWGRIELCKELKLQVGQFRLPFGTDCFRGPGNYIFANRSFIGKSMNNVRGVGAKLSSSFPIGGTRLTLDGGMFNPTVIADHNVWVKEMAFAAKAVLSADNLKFGLGAETLIPDSVRVNSLSASVTWTCGDLTVEGEYLNKHYVNKAFKTAHGYLVWADYGFPVNAGVFNRASVQARFDGMTAYSNGIRDNGGMLCENMAPRNRITAGGTLTYAYKAVRCDLRLNYEKYFYHSGYTVPVGGGDRVCAEMVINF